MSKILIAEDDNEIAMLERDYLEIEGYEVRIVQDGAAAVSESLSGGYDLILLDLMLPGCSGYEVCRLIRDKVDVPILMVTARSESVDKIRGLCPDLPLPPGGGAAVRRRRVLLLPQRLRRH